MDERNRLNNEKRQIATDTIDALADVMVRVFHWQVQTRGTGPYAAYRESVDELNRLMDEVKENVKDALVQEHANYGKG